MPEQSSKAAAVNDAASFDAFMIFHLPLDISGGGSFDNIVSQNFRNVKYCFYALHIIMKMSAHKGRTFGCYPVFMRCADGARFRPIQQL